MIETTIDPNPLKTPFYLELQHQDKLPEEYITYGKKLSLRIGLVLSTLISLPQGLSRHQNVYNSQTILVARDHGSYSEQMRRMYPCKMSCEKGKLNIPSTEKNQLSAINKSNERIKLDFKGPITEDFIFHSRWTGTVNGRRQVSVKQTKEKRWLDF